MELWADAICQQISEKCRIDPEYQKVLEECREREQVYHAVLAELTQQQRSAIDDYIAICEELEFQFARVAFYCGLETGKDRSE